MKFKFNIWIAALLLLSGCLGDLDTDPGDPNLSLTEEFFSNPEAYKQALAGVYANFAVPSLSGPGDSNVAGIDAGTSTYSRVLWYMQEFPTEEAVWTYEAGDPGTAELNRVSWTADNPFIRGMFGRTMLGVAFANEFLRQTESGVPNEAVADVEVYRAEVRFLRALNYYHMMDLFGQAPFVTESDPVGGYQAPPATREELFTFIESELLEIESQLPAPLSNEYGRADQGAAWALLAKIYLNAEVYIGEPRYNECVTYCEQLINNYPLASNYLDIFKGDNNAGESREEIIFPIVSDGVNTQNYGATTVILNGQVGSIEGNGVELYGVGGWGGAIRVKQEFSEILLRDEYSGDERNTLISTAGRTLNIPNPANPAHGYVIGKWSNRKGSDNSVGASQEFADTDFPMFRVADFYLMYAEATVRGASNGSIATATQYVNDLRTRAGNTNMVEQSDLTLELLLRERSVELYWEAHRRQDLIRFGLFTGGSYTWNWKGNSPNGIGIGTFRNLYPIPTASLAANTNLEQNPGY